MVEAGWVEVERHKNGRNVKVFSKSRKSQGEDRMIWGRRSDVMESEGEGKEMCGMWIRVGRVRKG